MRSGITRRWLRGNLLLTVLLQAVLKSQNLMLYLQKQAHQSLA